jgi:Flp pilus assembly protein TadD
MGGVLAEAGNTAKAMEYFSKAARLDPDNPAVHYNLSQLYEMTGKAYDARLEKQRYEELNPAGKQKPGSTEKPGDPASWPRK